MGRAIGASSLEVSAVGIRPGAVCALASARRTGVGHALEQTRRLVAVLASLGAVRALGVPKLALLALIRSGVANVCVGGFETMLLAIRDVTKALTRSLALVARAVTKVANKTSSAIVGLVHFRAFPGLVANVCAASTLSAIFVHNGNVTPTAICTDILERAHVQALLTSLVLRTFINKGI